MSRSIPGLLPGVSPARVRDVARSAFWLVPALCVVAAVGLAIGLVALDGTLPVTHGAAVFPGPPQGARSFLSAIIQAMISFTGLVFSITIVVLQLSSAQFSPRVLQMFLGDRVIQLTLGVFVATFVYAMVVLRAVRGNSATAGSVPRIAVTVAFGFVLASVVLFIRYISHVANMIRVASIITHIGGQSRHILSCCYPETTARPGGVPVLPPLARTVAAPSGGVLVSVNEDRLVRVAAESGTVLALVPRIGDFVPGGGPLLIVRADPGAAADLDAVGTKALKAVAMDTERTMEARLVVPQYEFADFLELAVGEIWHYGSGAAQVPARMTRMLADLRVAALPRYRPAIAPWYRQVAAADPDAGHPVVAVPGADGADPG